jgi:hypothetical protein
MKLGISTVSTIFGLRVWTYALPCTLLLLRAYFAVLDMRAHYVVRDPSGQLLGFCETLVSYVDQEGEKLIASLAILLVDMAHHGQGIGA